MQSVFFPSNHAVALQRFRTVKLYPSIHPRTFMNEGGEPGGGVPVRILNSNRTGSTFYRVAEPSP